MQERTITIFAGAGASKAVDPDQYPTTVEFFGQLPKKITQQRLFQHIVSFLKREEGVETVDVELVLWRLEELERFCDLVTDEKQVPGWLLKDNRLSNAISNPRQNIGNLVSIASQTRGIVRSLRDEINEQVYGFYARIPAEDLLKKTWIPLLNPLLRSKAKVEIFTTNYDLVIEAALDAMSADLGRRVDAGWRGTTQRTLDPGIWADPSTKGLLTKLHGSVNWARDGDIISLLSR